MNKYKTKQPNILIVAFDDQKTTLKTIIKALQKGTFPIEGKPVYLKAYPADDQSS